MSELPDLDMLLSVIENPTRRRILMALVREPHYPLQLSRELGMSQQAVMKHLKLLEEFNLVRSYPEQSDQGGPTRKRYVPTTKFTIIVDFGPGLFDAALVNVAIRDVDKEEELADEGVNELTGVGDRVNQLREIVASIDSELDDIQSRRDQLIETKERALEEAAHLAENQIDDYQVRRIVFEYIKRPELTPEQIAENLDLRDETVQQTIDKLRGVN
ncbi:MAG TPA: helix-turn-helix domain-containing protein [Methanomassiliicoccales archaeon]|nr:helix-turn-helix domain-containing protein [Methanomassiliicoccales archaeon]